MLLIVGLGNPGEKYKGNRHNIGFMAVDAIAEYHRFGPEKSKFNGAVREGFLESATGRMKAIILKPMTFMNESGRSVQKAAQFYKMPLDKIIVFHDELDLEAGKFRLKTGGGIAGHNGLRSIRQNLGADFVRARIGIGHPGHKDKVHSHVLSDFAKADKDWVNALTDACARAADLLAMGEHNKYQTKVNHLAPAPSAKPRRN
ncbi:MAG: aminoacyl-tRNA hydrolase [Robiginitomaculum sp.]|nr:MAG: aminoacyl-tRNA hydrolase [Robiginitomaculum sp.]